MSSDKSQKLNILLLFLSLFLCVGCGWIVTRPFYSSSADSISGISADLTDDQTSTEEILATVPEEVTEEIRDTRHPASSSKVSEVAGTGSWVTSDGLWYYVINNENHTGWLYDTDGKIYCFDSDGHMLTGWQEINNHIYYFDDDGIMQAGTLIIDDQVYNLQENGALEQ